MDLPFKKVPEATYLITDKSDKYRAILRFFYLQHERMRELLLPDEIFRYLNQFPHFEYYEMEELYADLDSLVRWGNLKTHQESGKVRTIEEFKKKRFRYQVTPYTVEFERMLVQFENQSDTFQGSLEKTQFERLYQVLSKIKKTNNSEEASQLWDDIVMYFKKIVENTSDYFAYLRSEYISDRMKTEAFLVYRDEFTRYLREFIIHLQRTAASIQELLQDLTPREMQPFIELVTKREGQIFRFEKAETAEERIDRLNDTWKNIKIWFLGDNNAPSQYEHVLEQTNEAIHRMTRMIQRMGERNQLLRSRKADYLHLADWFLSFSQVEEAHKLASVVFGLNHTRHLYSDHIPTDNMYIDTWEEESMVHERIPRIRSYRNRTRAQPTEQHQAEKAKAKEEYVKQKKLEHEVIQSYMIGNKIELSTLPKIKPFVRKIFLQWIGRSMGQKGQTLKNEYGQQIEVHVDTSRRITLFSEDGSLDMPDVTFYFLDRG